MNTNIEIRHITERDKDFWFSLDKHLSEKQFNIKVRDGQGFVLSAGGRLAGILRYNLFWDNTPFCTLLYIKEEYRNQGLGTALMDYWENEMKAQGYGWLLVSTQSDESAQHFYRKLGYKDCGSLSAPDQAPNCFYLKYFNIIIEPAPNGIAVRGGFIYSFTFLKALQTKIFLQAFYLP